MEMICTIHNIDFEAVQANSALKNMLVDAIVSGLLLGMDDKYSSDDIQVVLMSGSIIAVVTITPKEEVTATKLSNDLSEPDVREIMIARVLAKAREIQNLHQLKGHIRSPVGP